ncbi:arylsulfatase B isoform X2 [Hyalella azteca]|uniref:Arylsulfatase B isoform X2 n=1 Tax=Hyalella azteca TaxID=294128 RepID=A0A8B7NW90_HYAAZ|nr:arylsulfatase B isoform X2 [Hyalella azteca]
MSWFKYFSIFLLLVFLLPHETNASKSPPNIVFIVADDLGWNDVGFHGSREIPTPNIDALAYSGVILNNYYVQPICTPSRSAIMSGLNPIHTGLQHDVIYAPSPYGLPLNLTLLPEWLSRLNYRTEAVGKWHLGLCNHSYAPSNRGFDHHYGYWTGHIDYYDHSVILGHMWGYDFRRDMNVARDAYGIYATDLFTTEALSIISVHNTSRPLFLYLAHLAVHSGNPYSPLQAPQDYVNKFLYIKDERRRKFAAMLTKLDDSVGAVVTALRERNMLDDSIIVFTTDNGGPAGGFNDNAASNWPLRGVKASMWEGGVRGSAFVWGPNFVSQPPGTVSDQLYAIEDWLPTLHYIAGGEAGQLPPLDGVNIWPSLSSGAPSPRQHLLHSIDPVFDGAAVRSGDWKLLFNPSGYETYWDRWFGPSGRNETAPETDLSLLIRKIRESPAGVAVLQKNPDALDNITRSRNAAMVNCTATPDEPSFVCRGANLSSACLFHIPSDPCEQNNVASENTDVLNVLLQLTSQYNSTAVPILNAPLDPIANPKYWNYNWNNWLDFPPPPGVNASQLRLEAQESMGLNENLFDVFRFTRKSSAVISAP